MQVKINGIYRDLPDFMIVGAAKSGTTSLFHYLNQVPEICFSKVKEPNFFICDDHPLYFKLVTGGPGRSVGCSLDEYLGYFSHCQENKILGEASTWYLYCYRQVIDHLKRIYKDQIRNLSIIIILRNPVERAWSHYGMYQRNGIEPLSFEEAVHPETIRQRLKNGMNLGYDYLGFGRYSEQVEAYLNVFPKVKILRFEKLVEEPKGLVEDILSFLEVDTRPEVETGKKFNSSGIPKSDFHALIGRFLFQPNRIKQIFKMSLTSKMRSRIRWRMGQIIYRKSEMPVDSRRLLIEQYQADVHNLQQHVAGNLSNWLQL